MSNIIKPTPWDEIRSFYKEMIGIDGRYVEMVELVDFIENTGIDKRLFGYISLADLNISVYNPIVFKTEVLKISLDRISGLWHLSFHPGLYLKVEHEKKYNDNLVELFFNYISRLKW